MPVVKEEKIIDSFETLTKEIEPKPKIIKNCIMAFLVGGTICEVGQVITYVLRKLEYSKEDISSITTVVMVFLGALLTAVGIYNKIANFGGAGTVVPITGFANAVVAPAIEFKKEGFIFGVAAKMFTIAGPVLVYGIGTSVIIGIIHYLINLF
ncbi:stage V sporulation protein AC [Clostridium vincentii]|uniref:SpoVA protein n=1 Tax=Clostridium vincentii TaxID=52704 RepID=A0A2T0BJ68_9CLOT|nr:stage V sporulation protein AC [Clostridium vincentii]PRR83945.1 SpoVA protein [Clostridium vincentii]